MIGPSRQVRQTTQAAPGTALRIMVVDDSAGQRMMLSRLLGRWGYAVTEARDGHEALALLTEHPQDIILSDWMMPGIDGLEFCRRFRNASGHGFGYFILLTSRGEKEEVAQGLDAGADDFLTKPVNTGELRARINAGGRIVEMQRALTEQTEVISATLAELQEAHAAIERDLRQARTIQQALVPERHRDFGAASVSLLFKPCGHVGGDLVGMFSPSRDRVAFYALDVSGHGITSAMVTARVASYLNPVFADDNIALARQVERPLAMRHPDEVVWRLNQRLVADPGVDEYLTMVYATVDLAAAEIRFVQAGHPSPLLIPVSGAPRFVGTAGLPVGLIGEVRHETTVLRLSPGDRLLLYSDGFTEAITRTGDMLGEDGLMRLVSECGPARGTEFLDDLFWRLTQEMPAQSRLEDDVSAALFEYGRACDVTRDEGAVPLVAERLCGQVRRDPDRLVPRLERRADLHHRPGEIDRAELLGPEVVIRHVDEAAECSHPPRRRDRPARLFEDLPVQRPDRAFARVNPATRQLQLRLRLVLPRHQKILPARENGICAGAMGVVPSRLGRRAEASCHRRAPLDVCLRCIYGADMPIPGPQGNPMTLGTKLAWDDTVLPFQLDRSDIRGRVARLDGVLDGILKQHDYPAPVEALVAEMALLTALIGQTMKLRWKLSLQVQSKGPVRDDRHRFLRPREGGRARAYPRLCELRPRPHRRGADGERR